MQNFIINITQKNADLVADDRLKCFILNTELPEDFVLKFLDAARKADKLVLFSGENAVSNYEKYNSDGFILDAAKENFAQKALKEIIKKHHRAICGIICRNRRHEAMLVSECEPTFVIFRVWKDGFAENQALLEWYSELFLIQSASQLEEDGIDISALKTDFVILSDSQYKIFVAK